ncbi:hypothetical protein GWI33_018197 [Rhynchophorus ferrugineus]|uniref:Uncharacterized protein n=1 Tax=Rhynchophorus ferrugineus TaxID=354439 RepID=A0A834HXS9_RHYFE|nr:hypothetical protein GWI33_018197 [Rhynchophorus ferrugineus]
MKTFAHQTSEQQANGVASTNKRNADSGRRLSFVLEAGANHGGGPLASIRRRDARGGGTREHRAHQEHRSVPKMAKYQF